MFPEPAGRPEPARWAELEARELAQSTCLPPPGPAQPGPAGPDTYDLSYDQEPWRGAEELSVVSEAAAGGREVLREGAGSGGDRVRAPALLLFHGRAGSWPGSPGTLPPQNEFPGLRVAGQRIAADGKRANPGDSPGSGQRVSPHVDARTPGLLPDPGAGSLATGGCGRRGRGKRGGA